jgi:hypothetical protein
MLLIGLLQHFDRALLVGIDADVGGDRERPVDDVARGKLGVPSSASAAACAYGPPEPIATMPCSGSSTSPMPVMTSDFSLSATASIASSRLRIRSVRQSFASSTAERIRLPWCFSSFASKRSNSVNASAVPPANPAEDPVVIEPPDFPRARLDHHLAERDLAVAAERNARSAAYGKNRRAVPLLHLWVFRKIVF